MIFDHRTHKKEPLFTFSLISCPFWMEEQANFFALSRVMQSQLAPRAASILTCRRTLSRVCFHQKQNCRVKELSWPLRSLSAVLGNAEQKSFQTGKKTGLLSIKSRRKEHGSLFILAKSFSKQNSKGLFLLLKNRTGKLRIKTQYFCEKFCGNKRLCRSTISWGVSKVFSKRQRVKYMCAALNSQIQLTEKHCFLVKKVYKWLFMHFQFSQKSFQQEQNFWTL